MTNTPEYAPRDAAKGFRTPPKRKPRRFSSGRALSKDAVRRLKRMDIFQLRRWAARGYEPEVEYILQQRLDFGLRAKELGLNNRAKIIWSASRRFSLA